MQSQATYNYKVVRQFAVMTVIWGIVGMLVGVIIAAQLVWPELNGHEFLGYGRLRTLHTNELIFAVGGSALFDIHDNGRADNQRCGDNAERKAAGGAIQSFAELLERNNINLELKLAPPGRTQNLTQILRQAGDEAERAADAAPASPGECTRPCMRQQHALN